VGTLGRVSRERAYIVSIFSVRREGRRIRWERKDSKKAVRQKGQIHSIRSKRDRMKRKTTFRRERGYSVEKFIKKPSHPEGKLPRDGECKKDGRKKARSDSGAAWRP